MGSIVIPQIGSYEYGIVRNRKHYKGEGLYVGRPSYYGNPYSHLPSNIVGTIHVDSIEESVKQFREYAVKREEREREKGITTFRDNVKALRGRILVCWCVDHKGAGLCHAKTLLALAWLWAYEDSLREVEASGERLIEAKLLVYTSAVTSKLVRDLGTTTHRQASNVLREKKESDPNGSYKLDWSYV